MRISLFVSFLVGITCTLIYVLFLKETLNLQKNLKIKIKWKPPKKIWYFLMSYGLLMFSVSLISPFVIFYSQNVIGISMLDWGIVRGFFTAFMLMAIVIGGIASDKLGRKTALLLSFISTLFPLSLIFSKNLIHVIIAHIFASTLFLGQSSIAVYTFEKSRFARSVGIVNFFLAIAMVLGYSLGGFLYSLSPQLPFMVSSLLRGLGLVLGIFLI